MTDQFDTGEGLTHQTTWQDIAQGYRLAFGRLLSLLTPTIDASNKQNTTNLITGMIGAVDAEAELLTKSEPRIKDAVQELRELASALDTDLPSDSGYVERLTAIADSLETLY